MADSVLLGVALAITAWVLLSDDDNQRIIMTNATTEAEREAVRALIRQRAALSGVPVAVALAFAEVESNFNANAEGDRDWAHKHPEKYRQYVLEPERFQSNPARFDPSAWHSYGVFQLLAPHHIEANEHPRVLLDPTTNIDRGLRAIANALRRAGGDPMAARLLYKGCGLDGSRCDAQTVRVTKARFARALAHWQGVA
jgi:hypothetical protein